MLRAWAEENRSCSHTAVSATQCGAGVWFGMWGMYEAPGHIRNFLETGGEQRERLLTAAVRLACWRVCGSENPEFSISDELN